MGGSRPGCSPGASVSGINAQARRLQRSRAKGTPALALGGARSPPAPVLRRSASETSLSPAAQEPGQDAMRYSLYESPHLLLLQGYSQQHVRPRCPPHTPRPPAAPRCPPPPPVLAESAPATTAERSVTRLAKLDHGGLGRIWPLSPPARARAGVWGPRGSGKAPGTVGAGWGAGR